MTEQPEFKIALTNGLIQSIGDYLITRPYKEVAVLIGNLQQEVQTEMAPKTRPNGLQPDEPSENLQ